MAARDDHAVGRQRLDTVVVDVLVGDHVVAQAGVFEEGVDVGVRSEVPPVSAGSKLQHRPVARAEHHSRPVWVLLVVAAAQLGMLTHVLVLGAEARAGAHEVGSFEQHPVVGVRHVRRRGHEQGDVVCGPPFSRPHEERNPILAGVATDPKGVDAAREIGGESQLRCRIPPCVVEIVVVEVNGVPLGWIVGPPLVRPVPSGSRDRAGRELMQDQWPIAGRWRNRGRCHVRRQIPGIGTAVDRQRRVGYTPIESAVCVVGGEADLTQPKGGRREGAPSGQRGRGEEVPAGRPRGEWRGRPAQLSVRKVQLDDKPIPPKLLEHTLAACRRVGRASFERPATSPQAAQLGGDATVLDRQREDAAVALEECGAHVRLQHDVDAAANAGEVHGRERARGESLLRELDGVGEVRRHLVFEEPGTRARGIAAADAHEVQVHRARGVAGGVVGDPFACTERQRLAVPGDLLGRLRFLVGGHFARLAFQVS